MDNLIEILTENVKRNGEKPLTNKCLLNMLVMAERNANKTSDGVHKKQQDKDWWWK